MSEIKISLNEVVAKRFGEMTLSLCEMEAIMALKDSQIRELEAKLEKASEQPAPDGDGS